MGVRILTQEQMVFVALSTVPGMKHAALHVLRGAFGSCEETLAAAGAGHACPQGVRPQLWEQIRRYARPELPERVADKLERLGIVAVGQDQAEYPAYLLDYPDPPLTLFCKGDLSLLQAPFRMTMVGTRMPTRYGKRAARMLAADLARLDVVIVSGLALGIDAMSHAGALDVGGKTIAVLGCGVDVAYPAENAGIYREIEARGLLVSELVPGSPPLAKHFPVRNRIMSGLGQGVIVVEAGARSGTNHTVTSALEQGKEVLAVPGEITSAMSDGPNRLIREGCPAITCADDVLESMGWSLAGESPAQEAGPAQPEVALTETQRHIVEVLREGEAGFEEISVCADLPAAQLASELTQLQLMGVVTTLPGKVYALE